MPFGVSRRGESIAKAHLQNRVRTGILITAPVAGVVPEYDEREAARFALLTWEQYQALPRPDRAKTVAHYYVNNLIEAHTNAAIQEEIDRQRKR